MGSSDEYPAKEFIYQNITNYLNEGIIIVNGEGCILDINPQAEKMFNVIRSNVINKKIVEIIPGSPVLDVLETGKEVVDHLEMRRGRWLLSRHIPLHFRGVRKVACSIYSDVTEQEQYKNKMKEADDKKRELSAILEYSHDGIWIMDGNGITLQVSKSWEDFSGIPREKVVGLSVYEIVARGYYSDSAAIHVINQKKPVTIVYKTSTGKKALVTAVPVFDAEGKIWRIISNVRDITKLEQYRKELIEAHNINLRYQEELKEVRHRKMLNEGIIMRDQATRDVFKIAEQIATTDATVLLLGESGVGKDVMARYIHELSHRNKGPLISVNCGAIPETLMESEFFGYEGGSFTGANKKGKAGMFELANGGTLFLDEIGEMPLQMQAILLRVLQDGRIRRVGGVKWLEIDTRIIAATNQDLKAMVDAGKFREDLFYRLNVIPINIPPLRERKDDIIPMLADFLEKYNKKYNTSKRFSSAALRVLARYEWPGNIRELKNVTERLVLTTMHDVIDENDLPAFLKEKGSTVSLELQLSRFSSLKEARNELEKKMVMWALNHYGSTRKAASALGVTQPTVVRIRKKFIQQGKCARGG